jgi:predicted nucleic acid-binding protein
LRVDLARSLRRIKPERFSGSLTRQDDADLDFVEAAPSLGPPLLLDTCVYIDGLEGNLPPEVETLLRARTLMHLSVVLGELSHNFGRLDPGHPRTQEHLDELARMIDDVPRHRLDDAVSAGVLLEAGILSGLVFRLGGFQPGQEVAALNDATIYLHALEHGYTVLTSNIRDFDFMNQIVPSGRVLFYRTI